MFNIGFGSVVLQSPPGIEAKFALARQQRGQFIEFYYKEMDQAGWGPQQWQEIRTLSANYRLAVTYHLPWNNALSDLGHYDIEAGSKQLRSMLDRGHAIGAKFMILHLGAYPAGEPRLKVLGRVLCMIESVVPQLAEQQATLCLENNTALYTQKAIGCSVFEFDTIFDRLRSPQVGMCLDTGHAHVSGCLMEMTDVMAPHIRYVHLHDNHGDRDEHRAPGLGSIDWAKWYQKLVVLPHQPWVMLEYPREDGYSQTIDHLRQAEAACANQQQA